MLLSSLRCGLVPLASRQLLVPLASTLSAVYARQRWEAGCRTSTVRVHSSATAAVSGASVPVLELLQDEAAALAAVAALVV